MSLNTEDCEIPMKFLNELPDYFDSLIFALEAASIDDDKFHFNFV